MLETRKPFLSWLFPVPRFKPGADIARNDEQKSEGEFWYRDVKNAGSTARDHLANERTFLAWLRTGLSSVGLGLVIAKFTAGTSSIVGGALFICVGLLLLYYTGWRYFTVEAALEEGRFAVNKGGVCATLCLAATIAVACFVFVALQTAGVIT